MNTKGPGQLSVPVGGVKNTSALHNPGLLLVITAGAQVIVGF